MAFAMLVLFLLAGCSSGKKISPSAQPDIKDARSLIASAEEKSKVRNFAGALTDCNQAKEKLEKAKKHAAAGERETINDLQKRVALLEGKCSVKNYVKRSDDRSRANAMLADADRANTSGDLPRAIRSAKSAVDGLESLVGDEKDPAKRRDLSSDLTSSKAKLAQLESAYVDDLLVESTDALKMADDKLDPTERQMLGKRQLSRLRDGLGLLSTSEARKRLNTQIDRWEPIANPPLPPSSAGDEYAGESRSGDSYGGTSGDTGRKSEGSLAWLWLAVLGGLALWFIVHAVTTRCPHCGAYFSRELQAAYGAGQRIVNRTEYDTERHYNSRGEFTGTSQTSHNVPVAQTLVERHYQCAKCRGEWSNRAWEDS